MAKLTTAEAAKGVLKGIQSFKRDLPRILNLAVQAGITVHCATKTVEQALDTLQIVAGDEAIT